MPNLSKKDLELIKLAEKEGSDIDLLFMDKMNEDKDEIMEKIDELHETTQLSIKDNKNNGKLSEIKEVLKDIKKVIPAIKGVDLSGVEKLLKNLDKKSPETPKIDLSELKKISSILDEVLYASRSIAQSVAEEDASEIDYTPILEKISSLIPENFDEDNFLNKLKVILKDSLKITVNGGGGGSLKKYLMNTSGTVINPATEETLQATLQQYQAQELDDFTTTNVSYVGLMKSDETWLIKKLDETGNFMTVRYANVSNNATLTTYALAWAARTTATYGYLNTITI